MRDMAGSESVLQTLINLTEQFGPQFNYQANLVEKRSDYRVSNNHDHTELIWYTRKINRATVQVRQNTTFVLGLNSD